MPANIITWPAPQGEVASPDYTVTVDGEPLFVYQARVRAEILEKQGLWSHKPDCGGQRASFALFDMAGPVEVVVRPARPFQSAAILPNRAGIQPDVAGGAIRFRLDRPRHLTLLLDGRDELALHLFAGEPERDVPRPGDPNVVYFGPGVHELHTLDVKSGQTVYLAGGAVVRAGLRPGEQGTYSEQWKVTFYSGAALNVQGVQNVRICGRGILDGSLLPHPARSLVSISGSKDIRLEGIVLRDTANWNVIIAKSDGVRVNDVRIVSGRLNSDGINSVNSCDVRIRGCFVRNHDDSIVVKTTEPAPPAGDIRVEDCTIWNDWGYALGVTYETRAAVSGIAFRRCDLVFARHWCLGIHLSDGATVEGISFADIEVSDPVRGALQGGAYDCLASEPKLLRAIIAQDCWGKDAERGRIRNVTVDSVVLHGGRMLASEILGADAEHDVRGVTFRNVRIAGRPPVATAEALRLTCNEHVRDVTVTAG